MMSTSISSEAITDKTFEQNNYIKVAKLLEESSPKFWDIYLKYKPIKSPLPNLLGSSFATKTNHRGREKAAVTLMQ